MNLKNYKPIICIAAAVTFLGAAVFCGFKIYSHYQQIDEQTEAFAEIAEVVENAEPEEEPPRDKDWIVNTFLDNFFKVVLPVLYRGLIS